MSIAILGALLEEDPTLPTTLVDDSLRYLHSLSKNSDPKGDFVIFTALGLPFLQEWLKTYPEKSSLELGLIANGEKEPTVGEVVEILEAMESTLAEAHPGNPWKYCFRELPPAGASVWLYDEDEDGVFAGRYDGSSNDGGGKRELFFKDDGTFYLVSHWAHRAPRETAPAAPPFM